MTDGNAVDSQEDALSELLATLSTVRIGALTGPRDWWRFEPVPDGAFALLRPEGSAALIGAMTKGERGHLYRLNATDKTSRSADEPLYLLAPRRYLLWWTLHEERYAAMLEDPSPLEREGALIEVRQYHPAHRDPLRTELQTFGLRDDIVHTVCEHILQRHVFYEGRASPIFDVTPASIRALFAVEFMQWYAAKAQELSANNMATFEHAAAMIRAAEKGLRDTTLERRAERLFPTPEQRRIFDYFRDYAWRCAATAVPVALFEQSIRMDGPSNLPGGGLPDVAGGSSKAKRASAADGGPRDAGVLAETEPEAEWLEAAHRVRRFSANEKHGPALHPHFQGVQGPLRALIRDGVTLREDQQQLLVHYFESYLFGVRLRDTLLDGDEGFVGPTHYRGRMATRMADWTSRREQLQTHARTLLVQHASASSFFQSHADCYTGSEDLMTRYGAAAAYCGFRWWEGLAEAERQAAPTRAADGTFTARTWPYWEAFKLRIKPLADAAEASGKLSTLLGERLSAYKLSRQQAAQLLDTLGRLEITLAGGDVDATKHVLRTGRERVTVEPTGRPGEARISRAATPTPGAASAATLKFVRETATVHPQGVSDPPSISAPDRSLVAAAEKAASHDVRVPAHPEYVRELASYSKPFAVLADSLNLAIAVVTVSDERAQSSDKAMAVFDLTKGLVALVEGLPAALMVLNPELRSSELLRGADARGKSLNGLSTWLGRIDHVNKIVGGLQVLFSSESVVDYELRQGRPFRAELQRYGDIANVVIGAASALELTGAALSAAGATEVLGCSTALLAGFSATPWGLLITIGGALIAAGSALVFDFAQPFARRLMELERALDAACRQEVRGERLLVSTRLDALLQEVDGAWQRNNGVAG